MSRKRHEFLVLGSGPVARVMGSLLRVPVIGRDAEDTGWKWDGHKLADRIKLIIAPSHSNGVDRVIRLHAEAWRCPDVSRLAVLLLISDSTAAEVLLGRDVFGRGGRTDSTFGDFHDVIGVVSPELSLRAIISRLAGLKHLLVSTWQSHARAADCIAPMMKAIQAQDRKALLECMPPLRPRLDAFVWDSICFPTSEHANPHHYANAICAWLESVTAGVTPDWKRGYELLSPLATR